MTTPNLNTTMGLIIKNQNPIDKNYDAISKKWNQNLITSVMKDLASIAEETLNELLKFVGFDQEEVFKLAVDNFNTSELTILIMLGLFKGTSALDPTKNAGKQWNTMSTHAQNFMTYILEKVKTKNISFAISGKGKVITIPRLIITFPNIVMGIMLKRGEDHFGIPMDIPYMFCFPGAAGLFPKTSYANEFAVYIEWSKAVDRIINPSRSNPENVVRFANLGRENGVMADEERVRFMSYWKPVFFVTARNNEKTEVTTPAPATVVVPIPSPAPTKTQGTPKGTKHN